MHCKYVSSVCPSVLNVGVGVGAHMCVTHTSVCKNVCTRRVCARTCPPFGVALHQI